MQEISAYYFIQATITFYCIAHALKQVTVALVNYHHPLQW